jgi:hypothetical protein
MFNQKKSIFVVVVISSDIIIIAARYVSSGMSKEMPRPKENICFWKEAVLIQLWRKICI